MLGESYVVEYRKRFFWKKVIVRGHGLDKTIDRMDLYTLDGGILSLANWSKYDMRLGNDWVVFTERNKIKQGTI